LKFARIMTGLLLGMTWMIIASGSPCQASEKLTLRDAWDMIKTKRFVDLTHAFSPGIPHWKGFPDEKRETLFSYEPGRNLGTPYWFYVAC
jgi:hypothetical protein